MGLEFNELSDRKKMILKAVIDEHIKSGEPVGSKFLTESLPIKISSATIRNEMAELEEMGFLEQPHTSSGRVPSEFGYRFYVDSLMKNYEMTIGELNALDELTKSKKAKLDEILDSAAKLMGSVTNYTALAFRGDESAMTISQFKIVPMSVDKFLLVMITNDETVKNKVVNHSVPITEEKLNRVEKVLNTYLCGISLDGVTLSLVSEMERAVGEDAASIISPIVMSVYDTINEKSDADLKFAGVDRLLQYPEYSDITKFRQLLGVLEKKNDFLDIVSRSKKDEINIYIGSENSVDVMDNSSLVFRTITKDGKVVGAIGVIGPARMDYSKVVSTVDYLWENIRSMMESSNLLPDKESEDKK